MASPFTRFAFIYCRSLVGIVIRASTTASVDSAAFPNCLGYGLPVSGSPPKPTGAVQCIPCTDQIHLDIPANLNVTSIEANSFSGCETVISVALPLGITSIGDGAFYNCSSLKSVAIPYGVTQVGFSTFKFCSVLATIAIPTTVLSIGYSAFLNTYCCTHGSSGCDFIGGNTVRNCTFVHQISTAMNNNDPPPHPGDETKEPHDDGTETIIGAEQ